MPSPTLSLVFYSSKAGMDSKVVHVIAPTKGTNIKETSQVSRLHHAILPAGWLSEQQPMQ
jgi:hypothetical protein